MADDLKEVYSAPTVEQAEANLKKLTGVISHVMSVRECNHESFM